MLLPAGPSPAALGPGAAPSEVAAELLSGVGFSTHALQRFRERAGLGAASDREVEALIRHLLCQEGLVTAERPAWARSSRTADLYLQAGEWMLFILEPDRRNPWRWTCLTAVNGADENTWENALRRGYIHTPPPPWFRPLP